MPLAVVVTLAAIVAVAGAYYLFLSPAARRLGGIEDQAVNRRRQQLRRVNGGVLLALAPLFVLGATADPHAHPWVYLLTWGSVVVLLAVVMALASIDIRLTARLRHR